MVSNEKVINYKVIDLVEVYNFLCKVGFHLTLFEKVMIFLYYSMIITVVSYNKLTVKMSSPLVHMARRQWWGAHYYRGWWCKADVMMDYHRRLVRRSGGDTFITNSSYYEPLVIAITIVFNDTSGDRFVGDRSICSSVWLNCEWCNVVLLSHMVVLFSLDDDLLFICIWLVCIYLFGRMEALIVHAWLGTLGSWWFFFILFLWKYAGRMNDWCCPVYSTFN